MLLEEKRKFPRFPSFRPGLAAAMKIDNRGMDASSTRKKNA